MKEQPTKEERLTQQIEFLDYQDNGRRLVITLVVLLIIMGGLMWLFLSLLGAWGAIPILVSAALLAFISDRFNGTRKIHQKIEQLEIERGYRYVEYTSGWYKEILDKNGKVIHAIKGEIVFKE
jgi:hypothetical protein